MLYNFMVTKIKILFSIKSWLVWCVYLLGFSKRIENHVKGSSGCVGFLNLLPSTVIGT